MRYFSGVGALAVLGASVFAKADTFEVFKLSGVLQSGDALMGTMTLDTTTNLFTNVTATATVAGYTYSYNAAPTQGNIDGAYEVVAPLSDDPITYEPSSLDVVLPVNSPAGYAGSYLCSLDRVCGHFGDATLLQTLPGMPVYGDDPEHDFLQSGSAVLETGTSTTPEPGSFLLLGSGVVGAFGVVRRRLVRA